MNARRQFFGVLAVAMFLLSAFAAAAQPTNPVHAIDLPTALKLAGAQNLDVRIARERLAEARANHAGALAQFFPWLSPGITYRRHDDKLQNVEGDILDVHKDSYAPGAALAVQVDIGDALYKSLATKQLANAATHAFEAQRQESVLAAAQGYFDLALARASVGVAGESVRIAGEYEAQIQEAVGAGLAFKGDALRVSVQKERSQLALRQAAEQQRLAGARLSEILHLDATLELAPQEGDLAPLSLIETNTALAALVQQAMTSRPELKQDRALIAAARETKDGATYGPLIPSVGAQGFWGGLGGGRRSGSDTFGPQEDYLFGVSWRIGPGGLFDFTRTRAAETRVNLAQLSIEKLRDEIMRQVVEAFTRWQSQADQLAISSHALAAAQEGLRLAQQRKEFAIGVVLENIQAEQDLTRARLDYLSAIAQFNRAQYTLRRVTGKL